MAAIADVSDFLAKGSSTTAPPQNVFAFKSARIAGAAATATIAGRPASLWRYDGSTSGGGVPGAVNVPTNATPGALPFVDPGGGREAILTQFWATGLVGGTLILYDRLLHVSSAAWGNAAGPHAVGGAITRNTGGAGNFAMVEIYTLIGTTSRTVTMSYTDQGGDPGTSPAVPIGGTGFREVTRAIYLPLASGDTGVRGVTSITLSAGTGIAGVMGVTIGRPIAYAGIGAPGAPGWRDFLTGLALPKIDPGACLALLWIPTTTTAPEITCGYGIVES